MGMNFVSCCHKCKRKVFHFRGEEDKTMIPFYYKHYRCMEESTDNLETKEDQIQEEDWMGDDGYKDEWEWDIKTHKYKMGVLK